ncbi:azurin [Aquisalimonas lutea]|uniref:azurin n=1 Tax=Aquisalimonas lutea TaxID=1327750 RepID=UPI0025B51744|nr:azurin [Aquisalimonas lutea]MDN3516527.1 azurin [Aquisalimonas lutea]
MRFFSLSLLAPALLLMMPVSASAETCELSISGNDQMQYNKSEMVVGADCDQVTVELEHTGQLPADQMGHNWVLTETGDFQDVAQAGLNAGMENDYVPQDDDRVIAYTEVIGGGETTSVTFDVSQLDSGGDYTFFCSFPGHSAVMQGKLVVE